jgi:hypothetical protein
MLSNVLGNAFLSVINSVSSISQSWQLWSEGFREGLTMLKRSLIALALVAFIGMPVMAHPAWGYTTWMSWEWQVKTASCSPIQVNMKVVRWADIYCIEGDRTIDLIQVNGATFEGCVDLILCNNFAPLKLMAAFSKNEGAGANAKYYVSLVMKGDSPVYNENSTSLDITTLHLTGQADSTLTLCVRVDNVDPQY